MKKLLSLILLSFIFFTSKSQTTQAFTGTGTWVAPCGVTSIKVECWGSGGGGGLSSPHPGAGGGAGGGAYAMRNSITVTPGNSYTVTVGAPPPAQTNGNSSSFVGDNLSCIALGGNKGGSMTTVLNVPQGCSGGIGACGGAGGSASGSTGDVKYSGGNGGQGYFNGNNTAWCGGGGGGGGNINGNGGNGGIGTTQNGAGGNGGQEGPGNDYGDGGDGPNAGNAGPNGGAAIAPGGGSAGIGGSQNGTGAGGWVILTWNEPVATTPVIQGTTTICSGQSTTLSVSNPCSGCTYNWSNGMTGQSISVSSAGTYTATATNCSATSSASNSLTVTVNSLPTSTITPNGATTFCQGGSVTLTANTSTSYLWSNSATTQSISVSASGSYSVTVTNSNGCSRTSSPTTVTVNPLPTATITAGGATTFCQGNSVTLTASSATSYLWSNSATTQSISVSTSGNYSVTVTNGNGCSATSSSTTVTVNSLPTPTITASGNTTFCQGGSVTLTSSSGSSYLWSPSGETTQTISINSSSSSTVTVTNSFGCSATSSATTVTVNPNPTQPIITAGGNTTFCQGGNVSLTSSAGASYLWSPGSATTQSINATLSGSYSVTITNGNGCSATSSTTTVTVNSLPTATITPSGNTTFCQGNDVTLTSSVGTSYIWSPGGATTQSINVTASGLYSVNVTDGNGCSQTSSATAVTVNPLPTPSVNASGATTFCQGGSVTLTTSAGNSYLWSNNETTQSIIVSTSGSYYVWVTDVNGCAGNSAASPITVTVNPLPAATITPSGPTTFCTGGSVTLTSSTGTSYLWSPGGSTVQSVNVTSSDTYVVTVTNSYGCSAISQATTVTVSSAPTATITPSGNTTFCEGNSVTLTPTTGISYLWLPGGETSQSINTTSSGSYEVTVTFSPGCIATSAPVEVTVNPNPSIPTITAGANTTFCQGGSVQLTSSIGSFYSWSPGGAITQAITANSSGTYIVTVSDLNSCSASSIPIQVTVNPLPQPTITPSGATTFCQGGSVTLTSSSSAGNVWSPNGETAQLISASSSGNYTVTVTNGNGCIGTSSVTTITVNPNPSAPVIILNGVTLECSVTASSYQWYNGVNIINGATDQSFTPLTNGDYTVTITDNNGCQNTSLPYSMNTVGIIDLAEGLLVMIYPNPTMRDINIETNLFNSTLIQTEIKNTLGQIVYSSNEKAINGLYKKKIEVDLEQGIYFFSLQTNEGRTTKKIEIIR